MGIKYNEELKHYVVSYHRRHPITKKKRSIRRQGIKTKVEAERVYKKLIKDILHFYEIQLPIF